MLFFFLQQPRPPVGYVETLKIRKQKASVLSLLQNVPLFFRQIQEKMSFFLFSLVYRVVFSIYNNLTANI